MTGVVALLSFASAEIVVRGGPQLQTEPLVGTSIVHVDLAVQHGTATEIISDPPGLDCIDGAGACSADLPAEHLTLTESHDAGTHFSGWAARFSSFSLPCYDTGPCSFDPPAHLQDLAIEARYSPWVTFGDINVPGKITSNPPASDCWQQSCHLIAAGPLKFFETPEPGHSFDYWQGTCADAGTAPECDLDVSGETYVQAMFQ